MTEIADYDYIYNLTNYDYFAFGNYDYDYLKLCNWLPSVMITH